MTSSSKPDDTPWKSLGEPRIEPLWAESYSFMCLVGLRVDRRAPVEHLDALRSRLEKINPTAVLIIDDIVGVHSLELAPTIHCAAWAAQSTLLRATPNWPIAFVAVGFVDEASPRVVFAGEDEPTEGRP